MAYSHEASGTSQGSYGTLLQSFRSTERQKPSQKRRKLNGSGGSKSEVRTPHSVARKPLEEDQRAHVKEQQVEAVDQDATRTDAGDEVDDEDDLLEDPFQQHYVSWEGQKLADEIAHQSASTNKPTATTSVGDEVRKFSSSGYAGMKPTALPKRHQDLHLKQRLVEAGGKVLRDISSPEKDIAGSISSYRDVVICTRTQSNADTMRDVCVLHSLNHIFKTRDRVLKNNAKLAQANEDSPVDARDQGFTRPKVLIIAPTKQHCVHYVDSIVKLSEPDQQENKARFLEQYSREDEAEWQDKPEDFRELFGGNHEEDFRIGIKFTRKTIKYFSGFYNSDIIIGSPLGLMRTITGAANKEEGKTEDADFLSSIEVALVDHASALQMQNWQHVEFVFSHLNLLPKESHGCDFSRVRHWSLDGQAKYLRQTIVLSPFMTPEISSLISSDMHNIAGQVRYMPVYKGAMTEVSSLLPMTVHQTFLRFAAPTAVAEADARFKLFTSTILAQLLREGEALKGALLFVPSYVDFIRLRNHLDTALESTQTSFGSISEYTPVKEVNRSRSHFMNGRYNILLYSERAHHYFRYRLRGVRSVVFYGLPDNPVFWTEIVSLLGLDLENIDGDLRNGKGLVKGLFSKWDAMKLERIVGTERVSRLLHDREGDVFDFV